MSEVVSSMEDFWPLRGDVNQVSEEAVQRVQTQAKQAKQVAQQIKKDKAINHHLAQFLAFLIKEIKNENLITAITNTFFKTTNPKDQVTYLRKDVNTYVIVGFFIPFFAQEAEKAKIVTFYEALGWREAANGLREYVQYLGKLSEVYHDNVPIDQESLLELIAMIAQERLSGETKHLSEEESKKRILTILNSEV